MLTFHGIGEDEIKIIEGFKMCTVTADNIAEVQKIKKEEEKTRILLREALAKYMIHLDSTSSPFSAVAELFANDAEEFIKTTKIKMQVVCTQPLIIICDNFLSNEECKWGRDIFKAEEKNAVAGTFTFEKDNDAASTYRKSKLVKMKHQSDFATMMRKKIVEAFGSRQIHEENVQSSFIQYYEAKGFVACHSDYVCTRNPKPTWERTFTTLTYLSTCKSGGETEFAYLGIKIQAIEGRLLLFQNSLWAGENKLNAVCDNLSRHQGNVVGEGCEKYIITTFLLDSPWMGEIGGYDESQSYDGLPFPSKRKLEDAADEPPAKRVKV